MLTEKSPSSAPPKVPAQILRVYSAEVARSYLLYPFIVLIQPFHSYRRRIPVLQMFPLDHLPISSPPSTALYRRPSSPHTSAERKTLRAAAPNFLEHLPPATLLPLSRTTDVSPPRDRSYRNTAVTVLLRQCRCP